MGPPGIFSFLGGWGAWPAAKPWTNWRNIRVFRAAPLNSTRTGPEKAKSVNWKLPPLYLNTAPLNTQRTHSLPSTPKAPPLTDRPKSVKCCFIGGTVGTPLPPTMVGNGACDGGACAEGTCARVDVWLPEKKKNEVSIPKENDANAIAVLEGDEVERRERAHPYPKSTWVKLCFGVIPR